MSYESPASPERGEEIPCGVDPSGALKRSSSSKPMATFKRLDSQGGILELNREYLYGDVAAIQLGVYFDGMDSGAIETIEPAVIEWPVGSETGRLVSVGKAKPRG